MTIHISTEYKIFFIILLFTCVTFGIITFSNEDFPFSRMDMFYEKPEEVCSTAVTNFQGTIIPTNNEQIILEIENIFFANRGNNDKICDAIKKSRFDNHGIPFNVNLVCLSITTQGTIQKKKTIEASCS